MHFAHALTGLPSTVVFCKFNSKVRLLLRLEWLTLHPPILPRPQTSQTLLIISPLNLIIVFNVNTFRQNLQVEKQYFLKKVISLLEIIFKRVYTEKRLSKIKCGCNTKTLKLVNT